MQFTETWKAWAPIIRLAKIRTRIFQLMWKYSKRGWACKTPVEYAIGSSFRLNYVCAKTLFTHADKSRNDSYNWPYVQNLSHFGRFFSTIRTLAQKHDFVRLRKTHWPRIPSTFQINTCVNFRTTHGKHSLENTFYQTTRRSRPNTRNTPHKSWWAVNLVIPL